MSRVIYECGCSVIRSMFDLCKVIDFNLCTWHEFLYDEDKTIKQIVTEIQNIDRSENYCYCLCHLIIDPVAVDGIEHQNRICSRCNHLNSNGKYIIQKEHAIAWVQSVNCL